LKSPSRGKTNRGRRGRIVLRVLGGLGVIAAAAAGLLWLSIREAIGGEMTAEQQSRAARSPQWHDGEFRNRLPRVDGPPFRILGQFLFGGSEHRRPAVSVPVERRVAADYAIAPASGLRVTWLGHSTTLLEIDGQRVLIDPVWSEYAAPFALPAAKRFYESPLPLAELPPVDAVVISHDHYDHLDMSTVKALAGRASRWLVPLGVAAHLRRWGVAESRIEELDWWDTAQVGELTITATPARHFSGRGPGAARTLWAGWAFAGPKHRVFYSGDTALDAHFAQVGERLGPFDLTMMDVGAYSQLWADVHLGPEQAVLAHQLVRGDVMLPVHWGLFDLAMHSWAEPVERVLAAAKAEGVRVATPRPGELLEPSQSLAARNWWGNVPWQTAAEAPVSSSGVVRLRGAADR
jgi:L-ascorbate metabolism protein UlaG (beta-lactamase superfamily)